MKLAIVVPIKSYALAKQRLAPLLDETQRASLARVMAEDVLQTISQLHRYGRFVISDEPHALKLATRFGFLAIEDRTPQGQSAAVQQGFAAAEERGFHAALTIPGDVPGVDAGELEELCEYRPELEVVLVPDREGQGTNGLRLIPPLGIGLRFGEGSLDLHRAEAHQRHRSVAIRNVPSLAIDLDRPTDVEAFLRTAPDTGTLRLLQKFRVWNRISPNGAKRI